MMKKIFNKLFDLGPPRFIVVSFLFVLCIGVLLLNLPFSTKADLPFMDSVFLAMASLTVTGLTTVDLSQTLTPFGFIIVALLVQIGGIGIMSITALVFIIMGRKIGLQHRMVLQQTLNVNTVGGVIRLAKYIVIFALSVEGIAFILLCFRFIPEYGFAEGIFSGFFHAITGFNNAGLSTWSDNLTRYVSDPYVCLIMTTLVIIGGLGFTVVLDLYHHRKKFRFSLHTKLMIWGTLIVNGVATIIIFLMEKSNMATLGGLSIFDQWMASYFHAIVSRTAGFNTVPIEQMNASTLMVIMVLMFIGAGSGSVGGGIKLTTAIVILAAVIAYLRGKDKVVLFRRTISNRNILKALATTTLSGVSIVLMIIILSLTESGVRLMAIVFDSVAIFTTAGFSIGMIMNLSLMGKLLVCFLMFFGKIGPLTFVFMFSKKSDAKIRYPEEDILIS